MEKRHATQITLQTKSKLRAAGPGVPCDPHIHLQTSFFATLSTYHLPRQNSREAAIREPGADSPPGTLLSPWKPKSPELPQSLVGGGASQAALVTQAQPRNSQKGNLNQNTKHLTFYFQSKTSVKKKKELLATPRLCFSWLKASQELGVTPLPWGSGEHPPQPPSRYLFQPAQLRAGPLLSTQHQPLQEQPPRSVHTGETQSPPTVLCVSQTSSSSTVRPSEPFALAPQLKAWTLGPNSLCLKTFSSTF